MPVGEVRPPGLVKHSATSEPELAKFVLKLGPLWSSWARASGMNHAGATAVVKSVGESQLSESMMCSGMSGLALAGSFGDVVKLGLLRVQSTVPRPPVQQPQSLSLLVTVKAWPPEITKFRATEKSELAELPGELHDGAGPSRFKPIRSPGLAMHSVTTEPELVESSGRAGHYFWHDQC